MKRQVLALSAMLFLSIGVFAGCGEVDPNADVPADKVAPATEEAMHEEMESDPDYAEEMKKMGR